MVVSDGVHI